MDPKLKQEFKGIKKSKKAKKQDKVFIYTFIAFSNLIVVVLIGESKFFASASGDMNMYYDEYVDRSRQRLGNRSTLEVEKEKKMTGDEEKVKKGSRKKEKNEDVLASEELKKRADDFIARVNRQRRFEDGLPL
ncbi:Protoheme IX farnesyltransferase [Gossypium arboreum]|uniref:Protoheme IX farnesyltransferase n=1 Tax=Gossypium arboreum TaxID=29729 RepID=A0A0B0NGF7_GOSAR|nr:Protoheme IX farnesyltransferase [Gossypium arboreum]